MRILHVVPSLGPLRGGPSFVARAMATNLARAGLEVEVATIDDNGPGRLSVPLGRPLHDQGVTYWYFPRQTRFYTASLPLAQWLRQQIVSYDLVHIHGLFSFASTAAALVALSSGVPYVIRPLGTLSRWGMHRRRPLLKQISFQLLERRALQGAAAVHYTTEQERIEAADLGTAHTPVIIPLPVEIETSDNERAATLLRSHYPELTGRFVILFLSRLDPKKGIELLLEAFARAHAENDQLALVIAGSGAPEYEAHLHKLAQQLGIAVHTIWAGFLEGELKQSALLGAQLFVLPSYSENFGVAAVEAMAAGLPVIISDQVGIHNEVAGAAAGLVTPCSAEAVAKAFTVLGANPSLGRLMGERGRLYTRQHYTAHAVTQQLITLYTRILSQDTAQQA